MTGPTEQDLSEAAHYRRGLLLYPNEQPRVDYKAAQPFQPGDTFTFKLIKHIIGMANSGGGNIVIGYREGDDRRHVPDPELTAEIAGTYDVTDIVRAVNRCVRPGPGVQLELHKELRQEGSPAYPIITVRGFTHTPYFCATDRDDERGRPLLRTGALYVRSAEAATVELAQPQDWERLIELAVSRRQDDFLSRFRALIAEIGLSPQATPSPSLAELQAEFSAWVDARTAEFYQEAANAGRTVHGAYIVAHRPAQLLTAHQTAADLREAARQAERPNTGWPMGLVTESFRDRADHTQPVQDGLRTVIGRNDLDHFDDWSLTSDGAYFLGRFFQEDTRLQEPGRVLYFDTHIWRIAEAFDHGVALYRALQVEGSRELLFELRYEGLEGRSLASSNHAYGVWGREATQAQVRFSAAYTLDELVADFDNAVFAAARQIFAVFGFFDLERPAFESQLRAYQNSRVR